MVIRNLGVDITGDGDAHALSASSVKVKWVQVVGVSVADPAHAVRIGDSTTVDGNGAPIYSVGDGQFVTPVDVKSWYDLSQIYYWAASGDKIAVIYGF